MKDDTPITVEVVYYKAEGGHSQANKVKKAVRKVFPNSKVAGSVSEVVGTLEIKHLGSKVYDQKDDGPFTDHTAVNMINKIK